MLHLGKLEFIFLLRLWEWGLTKVICSLWLVVLQSTETHDAAYNDADYWDYWEFADFQYWEMRATVGACPAVRGESKWRNYYIKFSSLCDLWIHAVEIQSCCQLYTLHYSVSSTYLSPVKQFSSWMEFSTLLLS